MVDLVTELRRQRLQNDVSDGNTTSTPLGIGGTFEGAKVDLQDNDYATIAVALFADVDSAVDGLEIQASADDGVTWYTTDTYTYTGGSGPKIYYIPRIFRYYRVRFTNNPTVGQTTFILETTLYTGLVRGSSHRLEDNLSGEDDSELVKAVVAAKIPSGTYANVPSTASGALRTYISDENQDAFGRVRVSNPISLLDSTFGYNLNPRIFEDISSGNGTVAFDANKRAAILDVAAGAPGVAGLQSYQYAHYNPGKSQLIFMTQNPNPNGLIPVDGQRIEAGYFDDDNGLFARVDHLGGHFVRRSSVSGAPVDEVVDTADWNIDTMDGSGDPANPSGILLNPIASQILVIDFQFLGVGRVRMGFDISGVVYFAHEFQFANIGSGMYMQSGTLPVRWQVVDTTVTGWTHAEAYCSMVAAEGGAEENRGIPLAVGKVATTVIPAAVDTHLLSIQASLLFAGQVNRIWNVLESINVLNTGNNEIIVKVWYDANLAAPVWNPVDASDSGMEVSLVGTHTPGTGIKIAEFYVPATNQSKDAGAFTVKSRLPIAVDRAGTGRVGMISVTAQAIAAASAAWAAIAWREVR